MARLKKKRILKASNINQMIFEKKIRHCYTTFLLFICRITSIQVFNVFICETLPIKSHRERPPPLWPFPASAFIPTTPRPSSFPGRPFEFYRLGLQTCSYIYTVLWRMRLFLIFLVLVWRNIFLLSRKMHGPLHSFRDTWYIKLRNALVNIC